MSLELNPAQPSDSAITTCDTFHTANSSCSFDTSNDTKSFPSNAESSLSNDAVEQNGNQVGATVTASRLKNLPRLDDSDEMSSTEDYNKAGRNNLNVQSPSSAEKFSPEDRHNRARIRRKLAGEMGRSSGSGLGAKRITEAEALRAMQRLCQKVATQKMLVISSLENDCSKEELNHQIAVLQELQRRYIRLEMALQYSTFDNRSSSKSRSIMVTPIHETPLGGSDSEISTLTDQPLSDECPSDDPYSNGSHSTGRNTALYLVKTDPLRSKPLDGETEASDNVSTSNDELIISESDVYDINLWSGSHDPLLLSIQREQNDNNTLASANSLFNSRKSSLDTVGSNRTDQLLSTRVDNFRTIPLMQTSLNQSTWLSQATVLNQCLSVPCYVIRGAGKTTHHEYEVRIELDDERWALLRRYRRFRELYINMKTIYGAKVAAISLPSRQLWASDSLARERRPKLEIFLRTLLKVCSSDKRCPFYAQPLTKETLIQFSPFFRKGVFESGKCGTG